MRSSAPVHRGKGFDRVQRTPAPPRQTSAPGSSSNGPTPATHLLSGGGPPKRRSGGGGGGGVSKPRRADPVRKRMIEFVPGQQAGLKVARHVLLARRQAECLPLPAGERRRVPPELPLSQNKSKPDCSTPECHCTISHEQLSLRLALGSPSQVCMPRHVFPLLCPSRRSPPRSRSLQRACRLRTCVLRLSARSR